jgi:hypothetical protein
MTTARAISTATMPVPTAPLDLYRDDGPLARALGARLGGAVRVAPAALLVLGALGLFAAIAIEGDGASKGLTGAAIAWLVLCGGCASGRRGREGLGWTAPPVLRAAEYGGLLWIAAIDGQNSLPAAFALLAALAFRHYDLVYRLRYRGVAPPRWLGDLAGGWDGRLIAAYALLLVGALPAAFFVAAVLLAALFVSESVAGWAGMRRERAPTVYEDEEEEGH